MGLFSPKVDPSTPAGRAEILAQVPQLRLFTDAERFFLSTHAQVRHVKTGGDVYVENAAADSFAVLCEGFVAKTHSRNKAIKPIALVGALPLLRKDTTRRRRTAGLFVVKDATLIEISYNVLSQFPADRTDGFLDVVADEALNLIERLEQEVGKIPE